MGMMFYDVLIPHSNREVFVPQSARMIIDIIKKSSLRGNNFNLSCDVMLWLASIPRGEWYDVAENKIRGRRFSFEDRRDAILFTLIWT